MTLQEGETAMNEKFEHPTVIEIVERLILNAQSKALILSKAARGHLFGGL